MQQNNLMAKIKSSDFPKDFKWGVSTAAYQTEGAWRSDGKGLSIWDDFTNNPKFKNGTGNEATDFYNKYKEDIQLIKKLNLKVFRFSISWGRILPNGYGHINNDGIEFYHKVIDECIANGIEPWVTLYHWDLPLALEKKGGWINREIVNWFKNYVTICAKEYGEKVKHWIVLNEPMSYVGLGYFLGDHAPGRTGLQNFLKAAHHSVLCQAAGGRVLREFVSNAEIGTTFSCSLVTPKNILPRNIRAARRVDALLNRFFIEPLLGMGYPTHSLPGLKRISNYIYPEDYQNMQFDFDFIGIQYYFRVVVKNNLFPPILFAKEIPATERNVKTNSMGMEVHHKGFYKMMKRFSKYKKVKNIYITEAGTSLHDEIIDNKINDKERIKYLKKSLKQVRKAINNGINIKGYYIWTLTDNFEWAEGTQARFGLVYNDFNTQKRTLKKSGKWVKKFLKENKKEAVQ